MSQNMNAETAFGQQTLGSCWAVPSMQQMSMTGGIHPGQQPIFCQPQHLQPHQLYHQSPQMQPAMAMSYRQPHVNMQNSQVLDMHEVLAAVETLYLDELQPYGRILRKRLAERSEKAGQASADVDMKRLRQVCEACPWLCVQVEEGGDWSVLSRSRQPAFVDVYSPQDPYPQELWQAASIYFEGVEDANMMLPGGRYSCAQALISRGLPFLSGRTLGQVCHIVQLAISQKKILGYLNGAVVPYGRSQSMIKERCAEKQKACASAARGSGCSGLADWEAVVKGLKEILDGFTPGTTHIPLSNIKRLFRSRFNLELSETSLGHAKLSELLQDSRLRTVCSVRLQGHGYVVSPAPPSQLPQVQPMMSAAAAGAAVAAAAAAAACGLPTPPQAAHLRGQERPMQAAAGLTQPAQSSAPWQAPAQSCPAVSKPALTRTVDSTPAQQPSSGASLRDRARFVQPLSIEDVESAQPVASRALASGRNCQMLASPCGCGMPLMTPTPTAAHRRTRSVPRSLGIDQNLWERTCQSMGLVPPAYSEGGVFEEAGVPVVPFSVPATPETPAFPRWPMLMTPHTLNGMGYSVQNTFINLALPPSTPLPGSAARSHSLPRNMGASDLAETETEKSESQAVQDTCQRKESYYSSAQAIRRGGPANRLMSAAAAAASGDSQEYFGAMPATAIASNQDAAGKGQRVVRLADLL